ncbi:MAG: hypothetical protein IAF58_00535 [Leptolyngbya sp.]|nr:hypothetical protein [Candidatus Melainabacteria bacterium]
MNLTLKQLVKNTVAEFVCYRDGELWYKIEPFKFEFPVAIKDTGTGIFPAQVKGIVLMRWVRKHLEKIQRGNWQ